MITRVNYEKTRFFVKLKKIYCFSLYKMVDIEYIPDNYKSLKTNIWVIIKRLWLVERLRFHVRLSISGLLDTDKILRKSLLLARWHNKQNLYLYRGPSTNVTSKLKYIDQNYVWRYYDF